MASTNIDDSIQKVVSRARQKSGGTVSASPDDWQQTATTICLGASVFCGEEFSDEVITKLADVLIAGVKKITERSAMTVSLPPKVCPVSASAIDSNKNRSLKRKYEEMTLSPETKFGAFVGVPSYLQFVYALETDYRFNEKSERLLQQNVRSWCPKTGKTADLENPISAQLSRVFNSELADEMVDVVHQVPVLPENKSSDGQAVDIAVFVDQIQDHSRTSRVAVDIEYKPYLPFDNFRTRTAVYGTDTMAITKRSCVIVQIRGDMLTALQIRAFGVVPNHDACKSSHALSLLFAGQGIDALGKLMGGIQGFLKVYVDEEENRWYTRYLGSVVALNLKDESVYKAYDYREREVLLNDRRKPNLNLINKAVKRASEKECLLKEPYDGVKVLQMPFLRRNDSKPWFGAVPAQRVAEILTHLKAMHADGYVHGDIRLRNMILHCGILVDFDHSGLENEILYPSSFSDISGDGIRAEEVKKAIGAEKRYREDRVDPDAVRISQLPLKKSHDLEAMLYVLMQFDSEDQEKKSDWDSIINGITTENLWVAIDPISSFDGNIVFRGEL